MDDDVRSLVAEQITCYRAHAPDYDNDIAGLHPDWSQSIDELPIAGDVLELACGSGRWTRLLAARARSVPPSTPRRRCLPWHASTSGGGRSSSSRRMCSAGSRHAATTRCSLPSGSPMCPGTVRGPLVAGRGGPGTGRTGLLCRRHRAGTRWRTGRA